MHVYYHLISYFYNLITFHLVLHGCCNNQYTGQTPPAPIRGNALKKQTEGEEDEPQEAQEEVNVMDLIPRTDISGSITETIINELNDKNWKASVEKAKLKIPPTMGSI